MFKLWKTMALHNLTKNEIQFIFNQFYPAEKMNQKVFFYDPDKKVDKYSGPGLYGTAEIQKIIHQNQYPQDCSNRKYIVIKDFEKSQAGIGATLHFISALMAKSISQNRTLIYHPKSTSIFSSKEFCASQAGMDCFFLPLTNCSVSPREIKSNPNKFKVYSLCCKYGLFPQMLEPIMEKTGTPKDQFYFYWRMQTNFFLVRLNPAFNKIIEEFNNKTLVNEKKIYDVSICVRHGDKSGEMELINTSDYVYPLELLSKLLNRKLSVFVTSDDQNAIDYFCKINSTKFDISYFRFNRSKDGFNINNSNKFNTAIQSFAELMQSIKANYLVGTLRSNWNNLILQLRLQYLPLMDLPYFEVGNKPCVTPYQWKILNQELTLFS